MRVAIMADDLTGALDTASPFACRGARTICLTGPEALGESLPANVDVLSISTNSRHLEPVAAARVARETAAWIAGRRPDIILKKIDSRLKGNAAVEAAAAASALGRGRLLVAPAAPDIGRLVVDGAIVGQGVPQPISVAGHFRDCGLPFEVPPITSIEAMNELAKAYQGRRESLAVCSRGLAVALAGQLFPRPWQAASAMEKPILVAIGSRDEITDRQREAVCARGGFACLEAPEGQVPARLPAGERVLLFCTGAIEQRADVIAAKFAAGVRALADALKPRTVLCSGGDTARAVLHNYGQSLLQVLGEAAPGLPVSMARLAGRAVNFISKSGGFGGAATLLELFAQIPPDPKPN